MVKKIVILGVVLVAAGAAGVGWVLVQQRIQPGVINGQSGGLEESEAYKQQYQKYLQMARERRTSAEPDYQSSRPESGPVKTESQQQQEQQARLETDIGELATGKKKVSEGSELLYGRDWMQVVREYKARKEQAELVLSVSTVSIAAGLVLAAGCFLVLVVRVAARGFSQGACRVVAIFGGSRSDAGKTTANTNEPAAGGGDEDSGAEAEVVSCGARRKKREGSVSRKDACQRDVSVQAGGGPGRGQGSRAGERLSEQRWWAAVPGNWVAPGQNKQKACTKLMEPLVPEAGSAGGGQQVNGCGAVTEDGSREPAKAVGVQQMRSSGEAGKAAAAEVEGNEPVRNERAEPAGGSGRADEAVVDKAEEERFTRLAESIQQAALQNTENLSGTLKQLAEQVSAIREYAGEQQQRVKRLQDGYDWGILKNFCLRVIRCIDHLDGRIERFSREGVDTRYLKEVRDELIFSLESSGVEQFEAEINSDYLGQEKRLEAVKERKPCERPELAGKVAEMVRPGYQYVIDEDNIKIVRPALVRLLE
jgi:molecular chaperone GrpE (heat shock protein)